MLTEEPCHSITGLGPSTMLLVGVKAVNYFFKWFSRTSRAASCRLEHLLAQEWESTSAIH